jgi:hypothetical protein
MKIISKLQHNGQINYPNITINNIIGFIFYMILDYININYNKKSSNLTHLIIYIKRYLFQYIFHFKNNYKKNKLYKQTIHFLINEIYLSLNWLKTFK